MTNMIEKRILKSRTIPQKLMMIKLLPKPWSRTAWDKKKRRRWKTRSRISQSLTMVHSINLMFSTKLLIPSARPSSRMTSTKQSSFIRRWDKILLPKENPNSISILLKFLRLDFINSHRLPKTNMFKIKSDTWMPLKPIWTTIWITSSFSRNSSPDLKKSARISKLNTQNNGIAHLSSELTRFQIQ